MGGVLRLRQPGRRGWSSIMLLDMAWVRRIALVMLHLTTQECVRRGLAPPPLSVRIPAQWKRSCRLRKCRLRARNVCRCSWPLVLPGDQPVRPFPLLVHQAALRLVQDAQTISTPRSRRRCSGRPGLVGIPRPNDDRRAEQRSTRTHMPARARHIEPLA